MVVDGSFASFAEACHYLKTTRVISKIPSPEAGQPINKPHMFRIMKRPLVTLYRCLPHSQTVSIFHHLKTLFSSFSSKVHRVHSPFLIASRSILNLEVTFYYSKSSDGVWSPATTSSTSNIHDCSILQDMSCSSLVVFVLVFHLFFFSLSLNTSLTHLTSISCDKTPPNIIRHSFFLLLTF